MNLRWNDVSQLKRNILLNVTGRLWTSALFVIVIPIQVRILGIEAYGLMGFVASLQVLFMLLDLGLAATITREISMDATGRSKETQELIQSFSFIYWSTGAAIGAILFFGADWIGREWLHFETLPPATTVTAIRIVGIATALRWPIALFSGIISGLQRRDVFNILDGAATTLRLVGGVVVLLIWHSLTGFMAWLLFSALVEICAYVIVASKLVRGMSLRPRLSLGAVKRVWRFAAGMNLIALFSILFTQSDRQIIAKVLSMEALGVYSIAYNIAAVLGGLPSLVTSAIFPSLSQDFGGNDHEGFAYRYTRGSQLIMILVSFPAFVLMFFSHDVLRVYISQAIAERASVILALLALGFLLHALITMSYITALAAGRPGLSNWINLSAIWIYLPSLFYFTKAWGGVGAAGVWVGLNAYCTVSLLPLVHHKILKKSAIAWVVRDVGPIIVVAALLVGAGKGISMFAFGGNLVFTGCLGVVVLIVYGLFGLRILGGNVGDVFRYFKGGKSIHGA